MLFLVKVFDAIACIFVLTELCLVFVRVELRLIVPFGVGALEDVYWIVQYISISLCISI